MGTQQAAYIIRLVSGNNRFVQFIDEAGTSPLRLRPA
jgi:hypothetical protein